MYKHYDKDPNGEEKKLTDEEIVKALELCIEDNLCKACALFAESGCIKKRNIQTLDLIHRLQSENEKLYTLTDLQEANVNTLFENNMELRKEIERLTSLYDGKHGIMTSSIGDLPLTVEGLRTAVDEISRLLIVQAELQELNAKYYNEAKDLRRKNAELQKQVDELSAKKDLSIANIEKELTNYLFMSCSYGALVCGKMSFSIAEEQAKRFAPFVYGFIQQAVKDTVKEIACKVKEKRDEYKKTSLTRREKNCKEREYYYIGKESAMEEVVEICKEITGKGVQNGN